MTSLFEPQRKTERRDRAALIKARVSYYDALVALGLEEAGADCQLCGVIGDVSHGADGFRCGSCGEGGDVIELVRIVRQCGFAAACDFLERECAPKHRCKETGSLFGEDLRRVSRPEGASGSGRPGARGGKR